jgi:hypothetical protein
MNLFETEHPQFEGKVINKNYYGSELNKLVAEKCRKDMVVNNIDLIINDYKKGKIRIIESKKSKEKLSTGQNILLAKLSSLGIDTYVIYGNYPYDKVDVYSYQSKSVIKMSNYDLIKFLNNE